jgi:hypothetical protein
MSIQTDLTRRSILESRDEKRKTKTKEKVKRVFLVEETNRGDIKWR